MSDDQDIRAEVDAALERIEGRRAANGEAIEEDAELVAAALRYQRLQTQQVIKLTGLLLGVDAEKTVKALQEWETELPKLRAKLARVEALPAQWREVLEGTAQVGVRWCLDDIEAALKGEASG